MGSLGITIIRRPRLGQILVAFAKIRQYRGRNTPPRLTVAPGIDLPLHPFFGSTGVAPAGGKIDSAPPFVHAGNMDNKELVTGTALFIPVAAKGALFEAGDGHALLPKKIFTTRTPTALPARSAQP